MIRVTRLSHTSVFFCFLVCLKSTPSILHIMAFNFGQTFQSLTNNLQGGLNEGLRELQGIGATITPIAKRTTRMVQEKLGNADEIVCICVATYFFSFNETTNCLLE